MPPAKPSRARARTRQPARRAPVDRDLTRARNAIASSRELERTARTVERASDRANGALMDFLTAAARRRGLTLLTAHQRAEEKQNLAELTADRDQLRDRVLDLKSDLALARETIASLTAAVHGTPPGEPPPELAPPPGVVDGFLVDPRAYFFHVIDRREQDAAPDWQTVLESLPGRGMWINPRPGQPTPPDAPFCGLTVMIDAENHARGRIWLPTPKPTIHDGNAWFTREIQVIAEPSPGRMVWAWIDKGGAEYVPVAWFPPSSVRGTVWRAILRPDPELAEPRQGGA